MHRAFWRSLLSCAFATLLGVAPRVQAGESTDAWRERIGADRGIGVVLGAGADRIGLELARASGLLVYVQTEDPAAVRRARDAAAAEGIGATRFQIDRGSLRGIHLADDLADAVLVLDDEADVPEEEVMRVLRPRGKAFLGGGRVRIKPVPDDVDDWTHPYHGPDNNPLSTDRRIRAPYLTQFLAGPRYGPAPQASVAAAGRVFKAYGNVAWHEREEAYLNTIVAHDGYNGTILWERKLPHGMMVHRNTFVATPDLLYVGDDVSCKRYDTATGRLVDEIRPPVELAGGTFWKWMALEGGVLYAVVGEEEVKDPEMRWRRTAHGWPWDGISPGYNQPEQPWGFGRSFFAIDPATRSVLWHHREDKPADCRAVCMSDGRIYAFRFEEYLVCLDASSGKVLWRRTPANDPELFRTIGRLNPRQGWQTNWRTAAYLKCGDRALYFAGPQVGKLVAVSTESGKLLWSNDYDNFQLLLRDDGLYAISGPWGQNVSRKLDPLTGEVLAELPTGRRACTRPTGTSDSILYRAMGGSVRFDLASARPRWISPMRPPCQDGVTIANGLLYWWPFVCDCQLTLYGVTCVGSAGDFDFHPDPRAPGRLERADRSAADSAPLSAREGDWPTFRADSRCSASTSAAVSATVSESWHRRAVDVEGARPTAPTMAGGLVFLGDSDGAVRALDASTGTPRWVVRTGGEVRIPPTIQEGRAYVGSGDGWVYALDAMTGRELWRFQAAPAERRIPVYGRLLSTWPAGSGVLVEDGIAYVAAGIVNYDGTYVYALDARTGEVRWANDTSGHLDREARVGVSVQGHLLLHDGRLYLAGGNAVSPAVYDAGSGRCLNDPAPLALCESTSPRGWELFRVGRRVIACGMPYYADPDIPVYDHTVTRKLLHASTGEYDIAWVDNAVLLCYPPLSEEALTRCVTDERIPRHITQAWGTFRVAEKPRWKRDCPGGQALALARNAVVVAGPTEVVAWRLRDGGELWRVPLPAAPVPWGMALDAEGRVVLTLVDGQVLALAGEG